MNETLNARLNARIAQLEAERVALHAALGTCLTMMQRHTWLKRDLADFYAAQKLYRETPCK